MNSQSAVPNASTSNISLIECSDLDDLKNMVVASQMSSGSTMLSGNLFSQGGRYCLATALPLTSLSQITAVKRPDKNAGSTSVAMVKDSTNRPLIQDHANAISRYVGEALENNSPYILPSLTLNMHDTVEVFTIKGGSTYKMAVLSLPLGVKMEITDGQHRAEGVARMIDKRGTDGVNDSVAVMITFTADVAQVHQDFADCSKTRAITPSMLAVYDRRNPANGLVLDLAGQCGLFSHSVDSAKASVSARSATVWTTNQLRIMVKWALMASQCSDDVFNANAVKILGDSNSDQYKSFLSALVHSINTMTELNHTLARIAKLSRDQLGEIPKIREEENSILLTGSGLAVFGYLWNKLRASVADGAPRDPSMVLRRIAATNWRADSPFFADNLKMNPERTQTGQKYVKMAGEKIWSEVS